MLRACAFVPGHVTGFFEIHDEAEDIRQKGSRGAGICLSKGVFTQVEVSSSEQQSIEIFLDGKGADAPVTRLAVKRIIGEKSVMVRVSSDLELPSTQGFGMSGAGSLSASMALVKALGMNLSVNEMVCIAHEAEIMCRSGLGDVMPQSIGGVVIRRKEGCPPFGVAENMDFEDSEVVLCIIGKELPTKDIIEDMNHRRKINEWGNQCLQELIRNPKFEEMMRLSFKFSRNTGMLSSEVEKAILAANEFGTASMSMLGNSMFAVGDTEQLADILKDFGELHICNIDRKGMRIVDSKR